RKNAEKECVSLRDYQPSKLRVVGGAYGGRAQWQLPFFHSVPSTKFCFSCAYTTNTGHCILIYMELEYTYWKSKDGWFVGYLNIWPEHLTQGKDIPELEVMLIDLYEFYKEEHAEMKTVEKKTGQIKVSA
ncbi:MAG: hypothetical protein LBG95_01375, partial [Treponema sp.]|nr:hypothetical protein [Treponema sp.]